MTIRILLRNALDKDAKKSLFKTVLDFFGNEFDFRMAPNDRFVLKKFPHMKKQEIIFTVENIPDSGDFVIPDGDDEIEASIDGVIALNSKDGKDGMSIDIEALFNSDLRLLYGDVYVHFYNTEMEWSQYFTGNERFQQKNRKKIDALLDRVQKHYDTTLSEFFETGEIII